jgi:hypothetical protein
MRSDREASEGPVATLTVASSSSPAGPSAEEIVAALHSIYPADRFAIQHRAMVVDNETHVVFDVYEDGSRA